MKFRRIIQEKAMAETMRDSKGTTKFINRQYLFVVFFEKSLKKGVFRKNVLLLRTLKLTLSMKKILFLACTIVFATTLSAQDPAPATRGTTYGAGATANGSVPVADMENKMVNNKFEGKITGKVVEVCQERGCWMKVEKPGGETLMVKFKDYGFFMPKDIVGKEVVLDGTASVKETSVKQLQHYAKDAGKSKEEIAKIKKPKKEVQFVANGVLVL
jgi:hypothetical protein